MRQLLIYTLSIAVMCGLVGCKKYLAADQLPDLMPASQVFDNDANALTAVAGIYRTLREAQVNAYNLTIVTGLSADELVNFSPNVSYDEFRTAKVQVTNLQVPWSSWYKLVYQANAVIEGAQQSSGMTLLIKTRCIAEAKCIRGFSYLNLVNLFGEVPLVTSTNVAVTALLPRAATTQVYDQVVKDLEEAAAELPADYSWNGNNRTRVNSWVARALLARAQLYRGNWDQAIQRSSEVLGAGLYGLVNNLDSITLKNNREAIWQLATSSTDGNAEATSFIFAVTPVLLCTTSLLNSFETGDSRPGKWIKSTLYNGQPRFYPYKYKFTALGSNEGYILLRLAEQYLVRAEAKAQKNNLDEALMDINSVRSRSNLPPVMPGLTQAALLDTILHERRVELFAETGHRWFDLKRTGKVHAVMSREKPLDWKAPAALYPIPLADMQNNPHLQQNPGY